MTNGTKKNNNNKMNIRKITGSLVMGMLMSMFSKMLRALTLGCVNLGLRVV